MARERLVCSCPRQMVAQSQSNAVFSDLDSMEPYFPMVSRVGDASFFGLAPAPISPAEAAARSPPPTSIDDRPSSPSPKCMLLPPATEIPSPSDAVTLLNRDNEETSNRRSSSSWDGPGTATSSPPRMNSSATRARHIHLRQEPSQLPSGNLLSPTHSESPSREYLEKDVEAWRKWHQEQFAPLFSQLMPSRHGALTVRTSKRHHDNEKVQHN